MSSPRSQGWVAQTVAAVFLGALSAGAAGCGRAAPARPSIVLISVDTLRADHLPVYGYKGLEVPSISALARDSVRFENAYSHVPLTLPSHAVLLTGLLPFENGVRDNLGFRLAAGQRTLAERLRSAGYATGAAVSSYVLRADRGLNAGFDHYDDQMPENPTRERSGVESAEALARWAETVRGKPVFLFLHLYEPHAPYEPPEPYRSRYADRPYDGEIAAADAGVGRLLDYLRRAGLYERSEILFLSDHGEGLGDHGEDEHGVFLYRETLRVPLLWKRPGSANAGEVVRAPVGLADIAPTILSFVSERAAPELSGVSLDLTLSKKGPARQIYGETFYPRLNLGWSDLASLVSDRYQYIEAPRPELYDLEADPGERNDLAPGLPAPFRSMRAALAGLHRPFVGPEASSPEELKRLASLGYIHVSSPAPGSQALPDPKDRIESLKDFRRLLELFYAGKNEETIVLARVVLKRNPGMFSAWTALAGSLERTGRKGEAAAALREGLSVASGETPPEQLSQAHDDLTRLQTEEARSLEARGVALASAGKSDEARETLQRAWKTAPGDARIAFNLGILALHRSNASEARDWFLKSIQAKPDDPATLANLGLAQAALGDEAAAARSWTKAIELNPRQFDALYNLAVLELKGGRTREGLERLELFAASAPVDRYAKELGEARRLLQNRARL